MQKKPLFFLIVHLQFWFSYMKQFTIRITLVYFKTKYYTNCHKSCKLICVFFNIYLQLYFVYVLSYNIVFTLQIWFYYSEDSQKD